MTNEVRLRVAGCSICLSALPSLSPEPILSDVATYPMEKVSVDLFDLEGKSFLVLVDQFSGFPFVARLKVTSTSEVCQTLLGWFWEYGFPVYIKSDNGPQFRQRFGEFCRSFHIRHNTSSSYHPRSNGLAEAAVKSMKSLLKKLDLKDPVFRSALLSWRNTPRADGYSPAFAFFGRHLRGLLPDARPPPTPNQSFVQARARSRATSIHTKGGKELPLFQPGDSVIFQSPLDKNWSTGGIIIKSFQNGRSYLLDTPGGRFRRNRRFLRCDTSVTSFATPQNDLSSSGDFFPCHRSRNRRRSLRVRARREVRFDDRVRFI